MDTEAAEFLDGPLFVEWLNRHVGVEYLGACLSDTDMRRLREWRRGRNVDIYAADRVLICCGLMLSEVPEEMYLDTPRMSRAQGYPVAVREAAIAAYRQGASLLDVVAQTGASQSTIWKWVQSDTRAPQ